MSSNLRVNNILPSVGTNVAIGTAGGSITLTGGVTGSSITNTGVTTVSAGSTSAPSISPSGDSNTGIFFPSADTIAFGEGGAEALRITSNGDIGIGTAIPSNYFSYDLVVKSRQNTGGITIAANSTSDTNYLMFADGTSGNAAYRGYINYVHSDDSLNIASAGSVRATVTSGGNVQIANGNLVFSTSGTGIDFSATANSSGTMSSELLSDYEEGTWTPTASFGGGSTGITYSTQSGGYIKIGNKVTVWFYLQLSNKGSSTGDSKISGLPYTNSSVAGRSEGATMTPNFWTGFNSGIIPGGYVQGNQSLIYMINTDGSMNSGTIANTVWSNTSAIYGCATYSTF